MLDLANGVGAVADLAAVWRKRHGFHAAPASLSVGACGWLPGRQMDGVRDFRHLLIADCRFSAIIAGVQASMYGSS
jgi:hypothetical protein